MFSTKGRLYLPMALIIFGALPAMSAEPILQPAASLWSEPANGLSGRLRVEFEDLKPGLRYAVYLELRNHALTPVAVINQPEINAELLDPAAKPVSASGFPISGPIPNPQLGVIPRDASLAFRIDMQNVGVPTREDGMVLLAVGQTWGVKAEDYRLTVKLVFKFQEGGPENQWVGELEMPPVAITVTPQMLADPH